MKERYTKPYFEYVKFEVIDDILAASSEEVIKPKVPSTPTPTPKPNPGGTPGGTYEFGM